MKQLPTVKRILLVAAAAIGTTIAIAACSDADTLGPTPPASGSLSSTTGAGGTDTSRQTGGDTSSSHPGKDTSTTHPPAPKPVEKFTLVVHVGSTVPASTDTLLDDPIAGATVTVSHRTYVLTGKQGSDSLQIVDTAVGSATTDAGGNASFAGLKGTDAYVIKVDGPSGSGYATSTTSIYQAYFDTITIHMMLRKQ
jgi:hypothetical protein